MSSCIIIPTSQMRTMKNGASLCGRSGLPTRAACMQALTPVLSRLFPLEVLQFSVIRNVLKISGLSSDPWSEGLGRQGQGTGLFSKLPSGFPCAARFEMLQALGSFSGVWWRGAGTVESGNPGFESESFHLVGVYVWGRLSACCVLAFSSVSSEKL